MVLGVPRLARKISQILGVEVVLELDVFGHHKHAVAVDDQLSGQRFETTLGPPSRVIQQLRAFHGSIYHARARKVFEMQGGLCAFCGLRMRGVEQTETDHIKTRGRHGRDDSISNLRVAHSKCHGMRHSGPKPVPAKALFV